MSRRRPSRHGGGDRTGNLRFEGNIGGRVHVNVVQVFYWLCDRATAAGKPVESVHFELPGDYESKGVFL
jgi:hypothetical protein